MKALGGAWLLSPTFKYIYKGRARDEGVVDLAHRALSHGPGRGGHAPDESRRQRVSAFFVVDARSRQRQCLLKREWHKVVNGLSSREMSTCLAGRSIYLIDEDIPELRISQIHVWCKGVTLLRSEMDRERYRDARVY